MNFGDKVVGKEQIVAMVFELVKEEVKRVGIKAVEESNMLYKAVEIVENILDSQELNKDGVYTDFEGLNMRELDALLASGEEITVPLASGREHIIKRS